MKALHKHGCMKWRVKYSDSISNCTRNSVSSPSPAGSGQGSRRICSGLSIHCTVGNTSGLQLFLGLLLKGILCHGLERLLDVNRFLCGRLKVGDISFGLAPCHGPLLRYLAPCL